MANDYKSMRKCAPLFPTVGWSKGLENCTLTFDRKSVRGWCMMEKPYGEQELLVDNLVLIVVRELVGQHNMHGE